MLIATVSSFILVPASRAQMDSGQSSRSNPPVANAVPATVPPVLDGEVLLDEAWKEAQAVTGFWQITPNEGEPASEQTEVRLIYTPTTLYVGIVCHDREPSRIIIADSRRDAELDETDSFRLILDTY
ncbi:MAG: hypothetical protein WED81_01795, partial [Rhodothermales bacterium]